MNIKFNYLYKAIIDKARNYRRRKIP